MEHEPANYQLYVGIDIAATSFTAAWMPPGGSPTPPVTHPQTPQGFAALQRQLAATGSAPATTLVVLEATGSYWVALAVTLHTAGYHVSVVNPLQAHHFAKAQLRRAKTDPLDAQNLTQLAAALQPAIWTPRPRSTTILPKGHPASASLPAMPWSRCASRRATSGTRCCNGRWSSPRCKSISMT